MRFKCSVFSLECLGQLECSIWFEKITWVLFMFDSVQMFVMIGHSVQMLDLVGKCVLNVQFKFVLVQFECSTWFERDYMGVIHVWLKFGSTAWFCSNVQKGKNVWVSLNVQFSLKGSHGFHSCSTQFKPFFGLDIQLKCLHQFDCTAWMFSSVRMSSSV